MRITATAWAIAIALLALPGCQDRGPAGPTTEDFNQAREELVAKGKKGKAHKPKPRKPAPVTSEATEPAFAAVEQGFRYDPTGLRDPFRSFEWEQLKREIYDADSRGPLEQFDISQLSVVGVVWNVNNARALIQDPSGMSYIIAEGARIGKNDGRVIRIDDNLVVVKETYVDFMGEETTKDIEMQIHSTEGG